MRTTPRRINIIGTSGSGKTTLARDVARKLGVPHIELDALHWDPDWTEAPDNVMRERLARALEAESWVIDGNYSAMRELMWRHVDTVVWLDYTLPLLLWRILSRTARRVLTREELWSGNRESIRTALFSRDSIILWVITTYRRRRKEYGLMFSQPEQYDFSLVRLRSPRQTRAWLARLR